MAGKPRHKYYRQPYRRGTINYAQVEQYWRERELLDDQPYMTLSPEKDNKPWRDDRPNQRPQLLTAFEAHRQGFHAGARWGYQYALRRLKRRARLKSKP